MAAKLDSAPSVLDRRPAPKVEDGERTVDANFENCARVADGTNALRSNADGCSSPLFPFPCPANEPRGGKLNLFNTGDRTGIGDSVGDSGGSGLPNGDSGLGLPLLPRGLFSKCSPEAWPASTESGPSSAKSRAAIDTPPSPASCTSSPGASCGFAFGRTGVTGWLPSRRPSALSNSLARSNSASVSRRPMAPQATQSVRAMRARPRDCDHTSARGGHAAYEGPKCAD